MKIKGLSLILGGGLLMLSSLAQASIVNSKHNLSTGTQETDRVCVFCHTPHGSDSSASAPLWNKPLGSDADYQTYDELNTTTLDGEIDLDAGGISLACLSCHDGVNAIDTVLNAPSTTGAGANYNYDAQGTVIDGNLGTMPGFQVPNLGTDLRNDHPVGVQYAGGGLAWAGDATGTDVQANANDKGFVDPSWINGRLWVATNDVDLPLYEGGGATATGPLVECASCHNPHKTEHGQFLRVSNAGSALCTSCHIK